ncbi:hypothetical protein ABPG74_004703 [Tetrahymena malaccensis]
MMFWRNVARGLNSQQALRRQNFAKNITTTDIPKDSHHFTAKRSGFTQTEQAPFAYNDVFQYPKDYRPWNYNYKGNGALLALFLGSVFSFVAYERSYAQRTGRYQRKNQQNYYQV